ncbi:MAG: class I SAM-dependent methyltransferase [Dehalococcoidia bacterium]|nr:class I SAM-dependent methyltransferase [Dehalococcoidia bacterium]
MRERPDKQRFDFEAVFEPDDYLYFYGETLTGERTAKEVEFLVRELGLDRPMKVLDLACGYGRHSNRLAQLGHSVVGVDITAGFLEIAQKDAEAKGVNVSYIRRDMREIDFRQEFDRVLLLFTSFGYFEDEDNLRVLENIARSLRPGGLFCFDTFNRDTFLKTSLPYHVAETGQDLMINRISFDSVQGRLYNRRIVIRDGQRKDKPFFVRIYSPTEMVSLLAGVGLSVHRMYTDFESKPFSCESRRMIVIAGKV